MTDQILFLKADFLAVQCSPFLTLCFVSIGMDCVIIELIVLLRDNFTKEL